MEIRAYRRSDCVEIAELFHGSVHAIDKSVYTAAELEAWAPTPPDYEFWQRRLELRQPFVAFEHHTIIGFIELEAKGHIDCLYVHKDHQGLGVAGRLLQHVIEQAVARQIHTLHVEASLVARPFFEKYGFSLLGSNKVERRGQLLTNYSMSLLIESL